MVTYEMYHMDEISLLKLNALHHNHTYGWNYTNVWKWSSWMKFNNMDESDFAYAIDHINEIWLMDDSHDHPYG
jgi:hypothetical protein